MYGRAEGTPMAFAFVLRGNSENSARWRALFFRQERGSKSRAIQIQYLLWIQKEFLLENIC